MYRKRTESLSRSAFRWGKPCSNDAEEGIHEIRITEKCAGFDSPPVFCWRICIPPRLRQAISCIRLKPFSSPWPLPRSAPGPPRRSKILGAQGAEGEPNRLQQWLVPSPDPDHPVACGAVSPARRRSVSACGDRACVDPERLASRANAAAGIPRAGGVAGGARLCRAGAGTPGPWRHGRKISRGPGRLRRGRLRQIGPRHRGRNRGRHGLCAQATLHPARRG